LTTAINGCTLIKMKVRRQFDKATEARRAARLHAAKPGATRKIEDKRAKAPKHSKPLQEE
jgi:hypothetical protein